MIEVEHLRAHEIFGTNSAENDDIAPNSLITENTNTAVSIEASIGLGDLGEELACARLRPCDVTHLVVEAGLLDLADEDVVGLASDLYSLLGNIAKDANGNAGAGEWVPVDERLVDAELSTNCL